MKLITGIHLLITNPQGFIHRLRDIILTELTKRRLANLVARASSFPAWVRYGSVEFPCYNDGDVQEVIYHTHFAEWHQSLLQVFGPHVLPGAIVVDVGANLGLTTLVFSELAGARGCVHSFEPASFMHAKLAALVERNRLANVRTHQQACGRHRETLSLTIPASSGNASLRPNRDIVEVTRLTEEVEVLPLDEALPALSRLDFLKIDTEGFEIDVLMGAENTIRKHRPVIYIELSAEYHESSRTAIDWLQERGYVFSIPPDLNEARNGDNFLVFPSNEAAAAFHHAK